MTIFGLTPPYGVGSQSDSIAGRRVGGFRLIRLLGEGGMGSVFLAQQDEPNSRSS
ncbi:MAG TPA: hypothetical protein VF787_06770 [Thermoanaerobaculia bacterium]